MSADASPARISGRALSGPEKAAALLFAMGRDAAIPLLRHLEPGELRVVTQAATALGAVSVPVVESLIDELVAELAAGSDIEGSRDGAQALLAGAFTPEQVAGILTEPVPAEKRTLWDMLPGMPEAALLLWLDEQHPQVAAYLLTRLPPDLVARLLGAMPAARRSAYTRRMLACGDVAGPAAMLMETALGADIASRLSQKSGSERPAKLAVILNQMDPAQSEALLEELSASRPEDAKALRGMLFSFEDIVNLSAQARSILFDKIATEKVVIALRGSDDALRDAVLAVLSARAKRIVEAELASDASIPQREITKARRTIADLVLSLAQAGQIELAAPPAADAA